MKHFIFLAALISLVQLKLGDASNCDDLVQANEDLTSLVKDQAATIKRLRERLDEVNAIDSSTQKSIRIITRDEWLAQPAKAELSNLSLPVKKVIIAHTATESCDNQDACSLKLRLIQTFHMESLNWDDIGYNFVVGGDGAVYEGRGWDKVGAHTRGFNQGSIGIAFIGTFYSKLPNDVQLKTGLDLIEQGIQLGKLSSDCKILTHRQLVASESPGAAFYEEIKTWNRWSSKID